MEFIKTETHFNFVGMMKIAVIGSVAFIILGIASVIYHGGLNLGIDFAGGTLIQVKFKNEVNIEHIREALKPLGFERSIIQQFGVQEVLIRTAELSEDLKGLSGNIDSAFKTSFGEDTYDVRRVEVVGPKVGKDLTQKAIFAIIFSWIGILIYVGIRFEFRYALGGIIALVHDILVTVTALSLAGKEFDLNIVAALLTIVGFSINDTIVVFDRIRENTRKNIKLQLNECINLSVNQTLSRTILTSLTVLMVLLVLFIFGGTVIHDFTFALLFGVLAGTYSTVFIASPIVLLFEKIKPSKIKRKK
ncbi:MAG: protein translocase subunit SecF [Deltaproteobacteria bacterium]|nr:protein translocase subunit SecF [Deltaproteobacteria bacterium]